MIDCQNCINAKSTECHLAHRPLVNTNPTATPGGKGFSIARFGRQRDVCSPSPLTCRLLTPRFAGMPPTVNSARAYKPLLAHCVCNRPRTSSSSRNRISRLRADTSSTSARDSRAAKAKLYCQYLLPGASEACRVFLRGPSAWPRTRLP